MHHHLHITRTRIPDSKCMSTSITLDSLLPTDAEHLHRNLQT